MRKNASGTQLIQFVENISQVRQGSEQFLHLPEVSSA
jgi:hypothetical protein